MSFPVWCEIVCKKCADVITGVWTYKGVPRRVLCAEARQRKATQDADGGWTCKYCQAVRRMYDLDHTS